MGGLEFAILVTKIGVVLAFVVGTSVAFSYYHGFSLGDKGSGSNRRGEERRGYGLRD